MIRSNRRCRLVPSALAVAAFALAAAADAAPTEIKGAAILDHACGKTAVKHMGLVHAGKIDEAVKLGTKEMQEQWAAMPKEDREMMGGMMKDMASTEADHSADIKAHGILAIDGENATLTVKKETKEGGSTGSSTLMQKYKISGATCSISR
jgi:hypothetical protein